MSEITKRIASAGYWATIIQPARFEPARIHPITNLEPLLRRCHVEVRGWDFPHIDPHVPVLTNLDFIEQESEWQQTAEAWRFYQSGQFIDRRVIPEDWRDRSEFWPPNAGWRRGALLGIADALYSMYEVFEFAARYAHALEGDDSIAVQITTGGLRDRALYMDDPRRGPLRDFPKASLDVFPHRAELSRAELMAEPAAHAVRAAQELFRRFGREFGESTLRDWLDGSLRRR